MTARPRPVIWSIAGNDTGGGAGLAADLRAAEAFGVHLCPVVAALTAQNSIGASRIEPVAAELLDAQLAALADDMPPVVIKTGLLGSVENVAVVMRWIDRLRERNDVALVVDPVLGASSGTAFADSQMRVAYRQMLLTRATVATPNEREARLLLDEQTGSHSMPQLADLFRQDGCESVAITGGDGGGEMSLDWIATEHALGWLALPREATAHGHGTGCTFASSVAAALALGFVTADALVLAKMATTQALRHSYAAGTGPGPVSSRAGFATDPSLMPWMSWDETPDFDFMDDIAAVGGIAPAGQIGLYAIAPSAAEVQTVLRAGVRTVQLRMETSEEAAGGWRKLYRAEAREALAACRTHNAMLIVNDDWQLALELAHVDPAHVALHFEQEDLLAAGAIGRARIVASGIAFGVSSHSLWELARARSIAPWYITCGPVWPTLTKKAMPWQPQGLDNLSWWVHMAGRPVVAIGGLLEHEQATDAARCGVTGVCVVWRLSADPAQAIPRWKQAIEVGGAAQPISLPTLPHPSLRRN